MDVVRFIRAVEELITEVSSWLLCYPKTLLKTLIRPDWIAQYVNDELAKDKAGAFDEYMSPALFYALSVALVVFPHIGDVERLFGDLFPESARRLLLASPDKLLMTAAIVFGACPLGFAWVANAAAKMKISRSSLRGPLQAQFLIASPFVVIVSLALYTDESLGRLLGATAWAWFCVAEWMFFRRFLGAVGVRAVLLVLAGFGAWYFLNLVWLLLLGLPFLLA